MEDKCVCCGNPIPEGRQVCPACYEETRSTPCKDCECRAEGCHSQCGVYKNWFTKWAKIKERQRQLNTFVANQDELAIRRSRRIFKKYGIYK